MLARALNLRWDQLQVRGAEPVTELPVIVARVGARELS